jgi:hypothetical protein
MVGRMPSAKCTAAGLGVRRDICMQLEGLARARFGGPVPERAPKKVPIIE